MKRGPCPSTDHGGQSWAPQFERHGLTGESSAKRHKGEELEHLSYEGSLRQQGLSSLEKKRLRTSHQHNIYKYLKCGGNAEPGFFQGLTMPRTKVMAQTQEVPHEH